jgi:predicted nucleotidyltransferase
MDPAIVSSWAAVFAAREQRRRDEERARAREVLRRLPALADALRRDFGAERVGYFGSLATAGRLRDDSDVDLWVDAIRTGRWIEAVDRVATALERQVDLVETERAPESLRECIRREGVELGG